MDGEDVDAESLLAFEQFLSNRELMARFEEEYVDAHSLWNLSRIPDDGYAYNTRVQAVSAVKSYVDFVYDVEFEDREMHKVNHIVSGEAPSFDPVLASPDEVKRIFEETKKCDSESCHPMTVLGYDAIMRGIELCRVRWEDVNVDRGTIYVRSAKGSPERHIGLSDKTLDVLVEYNELLNDRFDDPEHFFYRFTGFRANHPWDAGSWGAHFKRHWDAGWHSFGRHSSITNRLNAGLRLGKVNSRARHARLSNTQKYIHFVNNGGSVPPELR